MIGAIDFEAQTFPIKPPPRSTMVFAWAVVAFLLGLMIYFMKTGGVDWFVLIVATAAFIGILKWKWNVVAVVLGSGLLGLIYKSAF